MKSPPALDPYARVRLLAEFGLLLVAVVWGMNFVVVKWALEVFEPLGFNAVRHVVASAFLVAVLAARGGIRLPRREDLPRVVSLGVVGHLLYQMIFVLGLQRTRAGNASLMLALVPIFMLVFVGVRGERNTAAWLGAIVSLAGVGLVSGTSLRMEGTGTLFGDFMLFCGAGIWAIYTIGAQPLIDRYGPLPPTAWSLWVGSIGLLVSGIPSLLRQDWAIVDAAAWGGVLFSSIFSIGIAYLLWYRGVQILGGPRTAIFANLSPLVALSAGAIMLGEQLTPWSVLGAMMVIGGVLLVRAGPTRLQTPD